MQIIFKHSTGVGTALGNKFFGSNQDQILIQINLLNYISEKYLLLVSSSDVIVWKRPRSHIYLPKNVYPFYPN